MKNTLTTTATAADPRTTAKAALHSRLTALRILFSLFLVLFLLSVLPTPVEAGVYEDLLRVHVVAASDSEHDQTVKLAVRDAVLPVAEKLTCGSDTPQEAAARLAANTDAVAAAAEDVLRRLGEDTAVSVSVGPVSYDRRTLGTLTFPAGEYLSLRVILGEGEGHNWWGILFPETALYLSSDLPPSALSDLSGEEYRLLSDGETELRFRLLEILSEWFSR